MKKNLLLLAVAGFFTTQCASNDVAPDCIDAQKAKENREVYCTTEYAPVCGCNNQTYSNSCEASKAGVKSWKKGKCGESTEE